MGSTGQADARAHGLEATAAALSRALSTKEVAEIAVREGLARLGVGRGVVALLDEDGHTLRTLAALGFSHDVVAGWRTFDLDDDAPMADAMRLREPIVIHTAGEIRERYRQFGGLPLDGGPAIVVPLLYEDRAVGCLYFRYAAPAEPESDRSYLLALGRQCAAALERARLYDASTRAWADATLLNVRMRFLARVGEVLAEGGGFDDALGRIAALAVPDIADWATVFVLDSDRSIRVLAMEQDDEATGVIEVKAFLSHRPPTLDDRLGAGAAIASGKVQLVPDYAALLETLDVPDEARHVIAVSGLRSVMHCPLLADEQVYGSLTLATSGDRTFGEADAIFGEELGRRVGTVLANLQLNARLASRLRGQEAAARLGQLAVVHSELEPLFDAATRELADVLDGDIVAIMQHVPARGALRIVAGSGWRDGVVGHVAISDNAESHSGFALLSDAPVVSTEYATETRFRASAIVLQHGARSGVATPIVGLDGPWGVLGVHSRTPGRFDADQIALLDTFANVLGSAISRRSVEIAVRDRDQRLELALAASRTGFWEWNVVTGKILWSDEICRLHGRDPGVELDGIEAYVALVHEEDRDRVRDQLLAAADTGSFDARFRIVLPTGATRWTQSTAKVFFGPKHRATRMIGVARDVTEEVVLEGERERRAEADRHQAELNQAFIGVLSHELRTPITSIFGGSKLLRRMTLADEGPHAGNRVELTADIEAEAERLYRLTEDLLVLTRVERGTLEIGLEPVAMPRVLERVIASEQERWPLTTIELLVQPGIPIALGDNTYIEQLIRNLVGNAAKYAPSGETVQVVATATQATAPSGQELQVRVLDRGPGLADADMAHLFDLFYRSPLTAKKAPGAGIGLFVCNQLADAMGGRLWASNRDEGGAEFGFALRPYASEDPQDARATKSSRTARAARPGAPLAGASAGTAARA